jgi:hypothetical protein
MISARTWTGAAAIALAAALPGCNAKTGGAGTQGATAPSGGGGAPAVVVTPPSPGTHSAMGREGAKAPEVIPLGPPSTVCGADKLLNYLNLLPTATAKDEIVKTLGHSRIRYVALQEAKATESATSNRVLAGLGVDGRIKEFTCG